MRMRMAFTGGGQVVRLACMAGTLFLLGLWVMRQQGWTEAGGTPGHSRVSEATFAQASYLPKNVSDATEGETPAQQQTGRETTPVGETPFTDLDPEERLAVQEEYEAISDGTPEIQPEEMPAYWRLLSWSEHSDTKALQLRAHACPPFQSLVHAPQDYRGQLTQLNLQVRRILSYEAPQNLLGLERLYEVWGTADQSQAWLYVCVTPHLPEGMPTGAWIDEQATFYGYFFKVQGYLEAEAKPRDPYLPAPLFVGRMTWWPKPIVQQQNVDMSWLIGTGFVVVLMMLMWSWKYARRGARLGAPVVPKSSVEFSQWLDQPQAPITDRGRTRE